ncbi:DUF418 domain-containing protein [Sphingomonas canadensis]|uniref:DUF418 domain-containing protein n=1 Tax=Sphingomonas canadensis TaxID=1219257 RepID=A0ABW3H9H9_9SPHN|nr:DUF418 domain-containing protein [Sphingomonas canadensis]MCW3837534.1 DUF418 domain-containing protein [Sphingomonas canadensis]
MSETGGTQLAPVTGQSRIDVIDMLRGFAILGIFFMNIPYMATRLADLFVDPRSVGSTPLDQASWTAVQVVLEGTQRGMLELLFGAGLMVLARRAMEPDGPVAVADLYARRNLWLLAFGLFDIFVLLWAGDILHVYALAALFLFPFRKLGPKLLLGLGLAFAAYVLVSGGIRYAERADLMARTVAAQKLQAEGKALSEKDRKALTDWQKSVERRRTGGEEIAGLRKQEEQSRTGLLAYAGYNIGTWITFVAPSLIDTVPEAFCMMLIGLALFKWGVIQGGRSTRFYLLLMLACYAAGMPLRWIGAQEALTMLPLPRSFWMTTEIARIAVSIGHVALINLLVRAAAGRLLLAPFKAAGRMAFSLYFLQTILGMWILFAPWGPGLWGKLGWAELYGIVLAAIAAQLVLANLWLRFFASGPLEWLWRSLAYVQRQPFRRPSQNHLATAT